MSVAAMQKFTRPTFSERIAIRNYLLANDDYPSPIAIWDNNDGTWAGEVAGIVFEAATASDLLRDLASILEEV